MTIADRPEFVQKMLTEFTPDFFAFLEDFTKDILNKLSHVEEGEAKAIACGLLIRFMATAIAITLGDLDAQQLRESLVDVCKCIRHEHVKFKDSP